MTTQPDYAALVALAREARSRAYCPYSGFAVGAAALTSSGRVFMGCNVENAAYPAAVCAERTALLSAYAAGEREIVALAVIYELAPGCRVALANLRGDIALTTPQELLPGGFTGDDLPSKR